MPVPEFAPLQSVRGLSENQRIETIYSYLLSLDSNLRYLLVTLDETNIRKLSDIQKKIEELEARLDALGG